MHFLQEALHNPAKLPSPKLTWNQKRDPTETKDYCPGFSLGFRVYTSGYIGFHVQERSVGTTDVAGFLE